MESGLEQMPCLSAMRKMNLGGVAWSCRRLIDDYSFCRQWYKGKYPTMTCCSANVHDHISNL